MKNSLKKAIIKRTLIALDLKKVKDIAILLNTTAQNINGYIDRGTFINLIEAELIKKDINPLWVETGNGPMKKIQLYGISDQSHTSAISDSPGSYPEPDHLIRKTTKVLQSDTAFRRALDSNIEAFHEAVMLREDLLSTRQQLTECQRLLKEQNRTIESMQTQHALEIEELRDQMNKLQKKLPPAANET